MKRIAAGILFDEADRPFIEAHSWWIDSVGYAASAAGRLHRLLMDMSIPKGYVVDHINRNKLDNRRVNLRVVLHHANLHNAGPTKNNTTGVRGVYYEIREPRRRNKFQARIRIAGKLHILGRFERLEDAAAAVNAMRATVKF